MNLYQYCYNNPVVSSDRSTSIYPVIKNGYKVLAVRKAIDYSGDYHFMKLDSTTTKTWSFKAGWGGYVLRAASGTMDQYGDMGGRYIREQSII